VKRKATISLLFIALFVVVFAICVSARTVYLEEIPQELKVQNDSFTHFVVFEEEKYFTGSGATISGLNTDVMNADMESAGIDASKIGSTYLTRYNFPAYMGETLVTYVNLNSMKTHGYFSNVCGYIQLAGTVNKVHDMNQRVSQLRCIDFGENSQVTEIPYCFANAAGRLMSVKNFPRNLSAIKGDAFNGAAGAFRGELYLNATTIEAGAFNNAISNVTRLVFGPNTRTIGNQSICAELREIVDFYEPADHKVAITEIVFECDVSLINFPEQGSAKGAFWFEAGGNSRTEFLHLERIVLAHPNNERAYFEGAVFGDFLADGEVALFDADGSNDFVTVYHSFTIPQRIVYDNFLEDGNKIIACSKCGATTQEKVRPIFTFLGYSYKISDTNGGIECGYSIDTAMLEEYKRLLGGETELGFVAFNVDSDSAKNVTELFVDGKLQITEKSLQVAIKEISYSKIGITVNGFNADSKDKNLAYALYITDKVVDGEETIYETSIIQGTKTKDGRDISKGIYTKGDISLAYISYAKVIEEE
jgi:hypothetical protein